MMQYFKDRTEFFDDYYPYIQQEDKCNLLHTHKWIQFFTSLYDNTTITRNYEFEIKLKEVNMS